MTILIWPESQELLGCANYREHSKLINGDIGLKIYGSSAYLVDKEWWEGDIDPIDDDEEDNDEKLEICYDDELLSLGFLSEDDFDDEDDEEYDDEDDDIEL